MTSVCGGGVASQRKANVPQRVYMDQQFVLSVLPSALKWLGPFLPYLPPIFIDMDAFCSAEPPTAPSLTEATMAAVLAGGEFGAALVAAELIQQVVQSQLWYVACECSSGTQPTAPAGQSPPSGLVSVNPPAVVQPGPAGACLAVTSSQKVFNDTTPVFLIGTSATSGKLNLALPAGASVLHGVYTNYVVGTVHESAQYVVRFYDASGTFTTSLFPLVASGVSTTRDDAIPTTARYVELDVAQALHPGSPNSNTADVALTVFCGTNTPGTPAVPCCPPDPNLTGMLTQILNYVTLIQRQSVPFGYVTGASHTALSGAGALSISGLLGIKIAVTTLPSSYGLEGTSPPEHFELGFVTFGTTDGFPTSYRLEHNPQVILPARCSAYTDLDYDLSPGVVVTITELLREP